MHLKQFVTFSFGFTGYGLTDAVFFFNQIITSFDVFLFLFESDLKNILLHIYVLCLCIGMSTTTDTTDSRRGCYMPRIYSYRWEEASRVGAGNSTWSFEKLFIGTVDL